tara:strand:+ start:1585 stop:1770 length:186 start_codon:yes stop_codon:yes gene_type:complete
MPEKTYTLTITYDDETEEIVEYQEYIDTDDRWFSVGDVDLTEYWDKEAISWIPIMHDLGDA